MSQLDKVKSAEDLANERWIKALIGGESKKGKTRSAVTLPAILDREGNPKPVLAIGLTPRTRAALAGVPGVGIIEFFEDEARAVRKQKMTEFSIKAKAWEDLYNFVIELWEIARDPEKEFPYSGIVLDDMTQANHYSMNFVLGLKTKDGKETTKNIGGGPAELHYVPQMQYMYQFFNSLLLTLPCHIVVCCHFELREDKETEVTKYYPRLWGKIRAEVGSWFDEVYECTSQVDRTTRQVQYFWDTIGTGQKDFLGSSMNEEGKVWTSPFEINLNERPCGFAKMVQLVEKYHAKKLLNVRDSNSAG